jgi:hypothetical protein
LVEGVPCSRSASSGKESVETVEWKDKVGDGVVLRDGISTYGLMRLSLDPDGDREMGAYPSSDAIEGNTDHLGDPSGDDVSVAFENEDGSGLGGAESSDALESESAPTELEPEE